MIGPLIELQLKQINLIFMEFKVHLFETLEEANASISLINAGENIPAFPDADSQTYTTPQENDGRIYIHADEVTTKYLGEPIEIELIYNDEI